MVQIVAGKKGKGKTKYLLEIANSSMAQAKGTIVFLDKNVKHMFELNRKIRLINVCDFPIGTLEAFLGFLCGIISQDHDLEEVYLDSFLKEKLPEAIFSVPEATYLAWVNMSGCLPGVEDLPGFFANEAGVLLEGGDSLFVGNAQGWIRLNLAMPRSIIETGLNRMYDSIQKYRKEHTI